MGSYNWNNPGQSYQDAMDQSMAVATGEQNEFARLNRIQQIKAEIQKIQERLSRIQVEKQTVEKNYKTQAEENKGKLNDIELKMAANRAKRGDNGDFYRWKSNRDANTSWQNQMNTIEKQAAEIQTRNEFNDRLNKALELWQKSKGDAVAEAYAKENVDGLLSLGKAKFGIDFSGKIAEAENLAALNKSNEEAQAKAQKQTESTQYKNFLTLNEKKPATFKTQADATKWLARVRTAYENGEISMEQAEDLRNIGESTQTKRKKKSEDTGIEIGVETQKAAAAAGKLTLDEFKNKLGKGDALTREESAALNAKKSEVLQKYETYKSLTGNRKKQFWNAWGNVFQQFNLSEVR